MTLDEYMQRDVRHAWWKLSEGERQNLFEEAADLIDAQREELELLRPLAPHYQGTPRCPTISLFCECPTCAGWREWRRRFGGAK